MDEGEDLLDEQSQEKEQADAKREAQGQKEREQADAKWAAQGQKDDKQLQWGPKGADPADDGKENQDGGNDHAQHTADTSAQDVRVPCGSCGLFNHATRDCRQIACEICGFNNHSTFDCKRCVPWNMGPELCAAQVEDQSFFYIEECIDPRVVKEKASTAVITVVSGMVTAKQIEMEFMNLIGAGTWRWQARRVGDTKFLMRFPTAAMATQWSHLMNLTMRNGAQIKIDAWSPSIGAKGVLQSSWFRVRNIPADQRSIRTLAKVGGLVGKVLEIDEGARYRYDYVRLRIACRDVLEFLKLLKVPWE